MTDRDPSQLPRRLACGQMLDKFEKDWMKLLAKYPDVLIGSDVNGNPVALISTGIQTISAKLPAFHQVAK